MPRRHRRKPEEHREPRTTPSSSAPIPAPPGWQAKQYKGAGAGGDYVCPRCSRGVTRATDHVLAWPDDDTERRRHWHSVCWASAVKEGIDRYRW